MLDVFVSDHFFQTTAISIIALNEQKNILRINPSFTKITGYSEMELVGSAIEKYDSLIKGENGKGNIWEEVNKNGIWEGEYWTKRKNNEPILVRATVLESKEKGNINDDKEIRYIFLIKDVTEEENKERLGREYQTPDYITGFANKYVFEEAMQKGLDSTSRNHKSLVFVTADLLNFYEVYRAFGYNKVEQLLKEVGERINQFLEEDVVISRIHSDNFAFFFSNVEDIGRYAQTLEQIRHSFETDSFNIDGQDVYISINMGVSLFPKDDDNIRDLFRLANIALEKAEDRGGNTVMLYNPELLSLDGEKIKIESDLRKAIDKDEFELYYQPQIDVATGELIGVEALIRWHHPKRGMVSPVEFIPIAEETGLIKPIEEWVLEKACKQTKEWQDMGYKPITMSVNMSSRRFNSSEIVGRVQEVLENTNLDPQYLEIEITESQLMYDAEQEIATLKALRSLGIKLSIDDFGTGYSSLSYLAKFPIDYIKIDRSFIKDMEDNKLNETIVSAIITLAQRLGMKVVAEGVETVEQLEFLRGEKCEKYQGYFYSPPIPADKVIDYFK